MSLTKYANRELKIRGVIDKDRRGRGMEVAISQDREACCSIVPIAGIQMPALCLPLFTSGIILCRWSVVQVLALCGLVVDVCAPCSWPGLA